MNSYLIFFAGIAIGAAATVGVSILVCKYEAFNRQIDATLARAMASKTEKEVRDAALELRLLTNEISIWHSRAKARVRVVQEYLTGRIEQLMKAGDLHDLRQRQQRRRADLGLTTNGLAPSTEGDFSKDR